MIIFSFSFAYVAVELRNVKELYFYQGRSIIGNKPVQQYDCRNLSPANNYCSNYRVKVMRCVNLDYLKRGSNRWKCEAYNERIPSHLSIANEKVICERHPKYTTSVIEGSCHLEFNYIRINH